MSINRNRKEAAKFLDGRVMVGSAAVARVETCELTGNCSFCFPHGPETRNHRTRHYGKKRDWSRTPPIRDMAPNNAPVFNEVYPDPDDKWSAMNPEFKAYPESENTKPVDKEWVGHAWGQLYYIQDQEYDNVREKYPEAFFEDGQVQVVYMGMAVTMFHVGKIADLVRKNDWAKSQVQLKKERHSFEDQVQEFLHLGAGKYVSL